MKFTKRGSNNILVASAANMQNTGDNIVSMVAAGIFLEDFGDKNTTVTFADLSFQRKEVNEASIVVLGGGGVFYDGSHENVDNYLRFIDHAHLMDKPSLVLGVGTQGITTEYGIRRYKETLPLANLVTVRDEEDARVLSRDVGVQSPIYVTQDLAFLLPELTPRLQSFYRVDMPNKIRSLVKENGSKEKTIVGISICSEMKALVDKSKTQIIKKRKQYDEDKITLVRRLVDDGNEVVLIQQSRDDDELYERIKDEVPGVRRINLNEQLDSLFALDVYRSLDVVIASRYHAMILSILAHKPTIVLDGVNSRKIIRTINSSIPALSANIYTSDTIKDIKTKDIKKYYPVKDQQIDQVNGAIIKARETREFVCSFLSAYRQTKGL